MAPYTLSDLLLALLDRVTAVIRKEIAEWKRAVGWAFFYVPAVFANRRHGRATVKQISTETV